MLPGALLCRSVCEQTALEIEIHIKLVRMRAQAESVVLFFLQFDPVLEEILGEDVPFDQEFMIFFECFDRSEE